MKVTTWLLTANNATAKIYRQEQVGVLLELCCVHHAEGRQKRASFVTDKQGSRRNSVCEGSVSPHQHAIEQFARQLAMDLETARDQGEFQRLYVAASPAFMGTLRRFLTNATAKLVVGTLDKDIVHLSGNQLCKSLPFAL